MHILRAADFRTMPWKNGGGETTEIVVSPPGASMDDFDWRVSMARVASDGPFSIFPGIDRSLTLLEGAGISLHIAGMGAHHLTSASEPLAFPGDVATHGILSDGPILDLNVMTRRGVCRASVERVNGPEIVLAAAGDHVLGLIRGGPAHGSGVALGDGDALVCTPGDGAVVLSCAPAVIVYRIRISHV